MTGARRPLNGALQFARRAARVGRSRSRRRTASLVRLLHLCTSRNSVDGGLQCQHDLQSAAVQHGDAGRPQRGRRLVALRTRQVRPRTTVGPRPLPRLAWRRHCRRRRGARAGLRVQRLGAAWPMQPDAIRTACWQRLTAAPPAWFSGAWRGRAACRSRRHIHRSGTGYRRAFGPAVRRLVSALQYCRNRRSDSGLAGDSAVRVPCNSQWPPRRL